MKNSPFHGKLFAQYTLKKIFVPTFEQKLRALTHIRYEIESLLNERNAPSDSHLQESLYLRRMAHARSLFVFFTKAERTGSSENNPNARIDDDVLSVDYGAFRSILSAAELEELSKAKAEGEQCFNKRIFHLTYTRTEIPEGQERWPTEKIFPALKRVCEKFIEYIIGCADFSQAERYEWTKIQSAAQTGVFRYPRVTTNIAGL